MVAAADLDEIEEVNANCILMSNLQQASTSGTQTDKAPIYDSDGSAEQYTELLEPIPEPHQVKQNVSNVISEVSSVKQDGGIVDQHPATVEETAAKFVRDFKSLAKEVDESLAKHKALELEIKRLLRAVVSQDIMSIVQNNSLVDTSNLQTELEPTKDRTLQAQLGDQKGKSKDTPYVPNTLDPLSQKLENENVELEFQILNYAKENAHLKTTYKNLFDSISVTQT
ncbi:hypothetical protein Tco_0925172 [Tanacetum coccineum]|uniref:Uncharacterized protein n=1 Tax=Tanacetum coccineum TaxID=301880 RepID=A0ABQ5D8X1_9ASTR